MVKRFYLIALLATLTCGSLAAQGFGLKLGYFQGNEKYRIGSRNRSSNTSSTDLHTYHKYPNGNMSGANIGAFYEYDIPGTKGFGFGVAADYQFVTDHDKKHTTQGSYAVTNDTTRTQHSIAGTFYLSYRIRVAKEAAFLLQTGPKFYYGIMDKVRVQMTYDDASMASKNTDVTFNRYDPYHTTDIATKETWPGIAAINSGASSQYLDYRVQPFTTQWMVSAGIQYQRIAVRFNYAWGLQNIFCKRRASNNSLSYRLFDRRDDWSVSLSYYLTQQKKK